MNHRQGVLIMSSAIGLATIAVAIDYTRHPLPEPEPVVLQEHDQGTAPCGLEAPCGMEGSAPCGLDAAPCSLDGTPCALESAPGGPMQSPCDLG